MGAGSNGIIFDDLQ